MVHSEAYPSGYRFAMARPVKNPGEFVVIIHVNREDMFSAKYAADNINKAAQGSNLMALLKSEVTARLGDEETGDATDKDSDDRCHDCSCHRVNA